MSTTLVIDGHPNPDSLCAALARSYADASPDARLIAVRDLEFDRDLRYGYTKRIPVEPDLADARAAIHAARHIVVVTPVWWRSVPAVLKAFLDRALLPQDEYRYTSVGLPVGLLQGRTARAIITADTPTVLGPFMPGTRLASFTRGTLAVCGLAVRTTRFGYVSHSTPERRAGWIAKVADLARRDAARTARAARALRSRPAASEATAPSKPEPQPA